METLTESGVLPLSHNPISPCGFYPKQDSTPAYYYSNHHQNKTGHKTYPRFPQEPERESWPNNQNMIQQSINRYPVDEGREEERNEHTAPFISPTNLNSFPQHLTSSFHQMNNPQQLHTSSLPLYSYGHISPLSREANHREDNKNTENDKPKDGTKELNNTFTSSHSIKSSLFVSTEHSDFSIPEYSSLPNDNMHSLQLNYYNPSFPRRHIDVSQRFVDVKQGPMYYGQDIQGTLPNVKNMYTGDRTGVISYSQSRFHHADLSYREKGENLKTSNEIREKNVSSVVSMDTTESLIVSRDQERQPSYSMKHDYPLYRKEIVSPNDTDKQEKYPTRDRTGVITSQLFFQEKQTTMATEGCSSPRRDKLTENDNVLFLEGKETTIDKYTPSSLMYSAPNKMIKLSLEGYDSHIMGHQYQKPISTMPQQNEPHDDLPHSTKQDTDFSPKSPTHTESRLYASTPKRPDSFPPNVQRRFSEDDPPSSVWLPLSTSSPQPVLKHTNSDAFKILKEPLNIPEEENQNAELKDTPTEEDSITDQTLVIPSSLNLSRTPQPVLNKVIESPTDPSTKLSPFHRLSQDEFTKINSSDDGSLDAKREDFSDEGEDDSADDSMSHSPTFSPLHDSSIAYPPQFPHPFFQSQTHGPFSGLRYPFASLQRHHDTGIPGTGFPFGSLPGMSQEMSLLGPMHPSRPPFLGSIPPNLGPARQMTGEKDIYYCHLCSYSGKSKPDFDIHMNTHFEFNCPHCDYTSRTEGRLKRHIKDFHTDDSSRRSTPGRPKVYKCKQCPFSATEKDKFWAHSRTHIKEDKLLQCPKCPFVTEYKHHLEYHLRNHFGSKPFKCPKCNYSCVNKSMLNSHMKSHTNVYQYRCSECTYATKYCHSLKLHLKKYNHKPATVLNQDGSLPQGLDAESSGLSIVSKRGPPRGPRGTRKEKTDPYLSRLFEMPQMPLGVNPILNGMMPFWQMLPQGGIPGHPSAHQGFLPAMRNLTQELSIKDNHKENIDDTSEDINENSCEEFKNNIKDKVEICRLCSFVAESREALGLHLMQEHRQVAKEVFLSCGFSEAFLLETFIQANTNKILKEQKISELEKESESDQSSNDLNQRSSENNILRKESSKFLQNKSHQMEESAKTSPTPGLLSSYSDNQNDERKLQELYYPSADHRNLSENERYHSSRGLDILQQMTLKFGSGVMPDKMRQNVMEDDGIGMKESYKEQQELKTNENPRLNQTPLDLTKPRSTSPPSDNVSPKQEDNQSQSLKQEDNQSQSLKQEDNQSQSPKYEENRFHYVGEGRYKNPKVELIRKRSVTELEDVTNAKSSITDLSVVPPRKRSRKGKAYKLDTLCLKLHKRQAGSSHDEDENDMNMETDFQFKPLQSNEVEGKSPTRTAKLENKFVEDKDYSKNTDGSMRIVNEMNKNVTKEAIDIIKSPEVFQDEAEYELQKLQKSLSILDQGINLGNVESALNKESHNKDKQHDSIIVNKDGTKNSYLKDKSSNEAINKDDIFSDSEEDREAAPSTELTEKHLEGQVDQVEMINTVLENRKKPVPPEVRRGTELAWKLLNDPINPVTTLPLPVEALPTPQPLKSTLESSSSTTKFTDLNNTLDLKKDVKPQAMLSQSTQPYSLIPKLHIPNVRHPLPPHLLHHPHTVRSTLPSHHPHISQPLISIKPPLSIPVPSTPMAYIPPTNRMMTESTLTLQNSRVKSAPKELYECTFCDLSFRDCVMYTVHMGYHSNQNPFQCNSCGVVSRDKVEFFLHIARSPHA